MRTIFLVIGLLFTNTVFCQSFSFQSIYHIKGANSQEIIHSCQDQEGNFYMVGRNFGSAYLNPALLLNPVNTNGLNDIFVVKTSSTGIFIWGKQIGGIKADNSFFINTDSENNVYLTGGFVDQVDFDPGSGTELRTSSSPYSNGFVLKLDSNGEFISVKTIESSSISFVNFIKWDSNNNMYISLYFGGNSNLNDFGIQESLTSNGGNDCLILKYDPEGELIWQKFLTGTNVQYGGLFEIDKNDDLVVSYIFKGTIEVQSNGIDTTFTAPADFNTLLQKISKDGNTLWSKHIYTTSKAELFNVNIDSENNYYISGTFKESMNSELFDHNPIVGTPNSNAIILKLDQNGNYLLHKSIPGKFSSVGFTGMDHQDNLLFGASFTNQISAFDENISNFTSNGETDMFICVFDRELNVIRAVKIGGAYTDLVHQVYFSQNHEICIAGGFSGNVDFNPNISTNYVYAQNFDGFYLKWNFTNTANLEETDQRNMTVLNLNGWLEISGIDQISSIELISMNGSRVKPITEWNGDKIRVYSDHLSNGVYFLSVVTTQMEFIQKVVIVK